MNQAAPASWATDNVIEMYAPNHVPMCCTCISMIPAGTMFQLKQRLPVHVECPPFRHLRAVT